ncbi:MAG: DUF2975 domain-containing protein [Clostridiales bacterium]|nr:DUF2975 domain-containing protein [Clostridiales bacterium]
MKKDSFALRLKVVAVIAAVMCIALFFVVFPLLGSTISANYPEFAYAFWPCLIYLWVMSVPIFIALWEFYKISREIGLDNSFSVENSVSLDRISKLAIIDTVLLFIGVIVMMALSLLPVSVFVAAIIIAILGVVLSVVCAALSHLVLKAKKLKDENDLTI